MATAFPDVKPFPGAGLPLAGIGHNKPPLDESVVADFMADITTAALPGKIEQLEARAKAAGPCTDHEIAGRYGDGIKVVAAVVKAINAARETHNRPLLTAQRALKGRADSYIDRLTAVERTLRSKVEAFMAEERRKADEQRRQAEAEARAAREAAERERERQMEEAAAAGAPAPEPLPEPVIAAAKVEEPTARGDYGARVGSTTQWKFEIQSVRQVPDVYLKNPKVVEALEKVIGAAVRSGTRTIKGVRIWDEQATVIR